MGANDKVAATFHGVTAKELAQLIKEVKAQTLREAALMVISDLSVEHPAAVRIARRLRHEASITLGD